MKTSDPKPKIENHGKVLERLRESSFAPAAALGAFASFASAAFGAKSEAAAKTVRSNASLVQMDISAQKQDTLKPPLDLEYAPTLVLGSANAEQRFRRSIAAVAVGDADHIYVLGDGAVRTFDSRGNFVRNWKAPEGVSCMAIGGSRVYLAGGGKVDIFSPAGIREGGFAAGVSGKSASITAIKISGSEILVADASARCILRYTETGRLIGEIGTQNKTRGFMLPNRSLDMDVDSKGVIRATDSGRHRVSAWILDGTPAGYFGKFGLRNPEDFVGCCNPVNIAAAPDGKIITAEKVIARVKVFDAAGKLLSLIGPEHFDPQCIHLYLAVDSRGRIVVADPIRLEVKVFSIKNQSGGLAQI